MKELPRNVILQGDALDRLRELPDASIDTVVTSPPYPGQRNYFTAGQIGLEDSVGEWLDRLRPIMAEVHRVLTPTSSAWINLGDTYSRSARVGAPRKSLLLAPQRFALALVDEGWICRNVAVWAKTNPMPSSVGDRLSNTYDVVLHLVKQEHYFYDLDAIREAHRSQQARVERTSRKTRPEWSGPHAGSNSGLSRFRPPGIPGALLGKNPGDVWTLPSAHYLGAHYATFPERLVERPILATCPLRVCTECARPWRRGPGKTFVLGKRTPATQSDRYVRRYSGSWRVLHQPGPIVADCRCEAAWRPGLVLDPFFGTGTVGAVAQRLGRDWLGIELNPDYVDLAWKRLGRKSPPLERAA
jgi:site-specific DNA-methyltransferase (adenine-specific)